MKTIDDVLDELQPGDGWWKQGTEDAIRQVLTELEPEVGIDRATDLVECVIDAIREEYGDG